MQKCNTSGPFFDLERSSHAFLLMRSDLLKAGFHRSIRKKLLRAMKWTIFLMVASTLHVSANGFSQNVKITMAERQIKLERFFRLAEKQTDYRFSYSTSLVPITHKIDVIAKDEPLVRVLERILPELGMRYRLLNKNVIGITPVPAIAAITFADTTITVMGRIFDPKGQPVVSASIMIKGTRLGETTDERHHYSKCHRFQLTGTFASWQQEYRDQDGSRESCRPPGSDGREHRLPGHFKRTRYRFLFIHQSYPSPLQTETGYRSCH
jgi:hypothetical protein